MNVSYTYTDPKQSAMGAYEGASRTSQEIALWTPASLSADRDLLPDKPMLDARAKEQIRNDGYAAGGVHIHQDSIVGGRFLLNSKPNLRILRSFNKAFDEQWAVEFQEEFEARFHLYAESSENWLDASRHNTFTELVRLAVGIDVYSGEVLATAEWLRDAGRPYHTAIQMVDVDRLSNPAGVPETKRIRGGIESNKFGAPTVFHIRMAHPSDWDDHNAYWWKPVPIRKPWGRQQVIHLFEQRRPDQSRGVSDIVSVLKQMRMTRKYQDIVLQNAVVNATYAAIIESELPPDAAYPQLGEGGSSTWAQQYMAQIAAYAGGSKNLHIDGVKIPHLYPGTKLRMVNPGNPGGVGTNYEASLLRHIAASFGLSYEQFSRDYTKTNYSSARASMGETWKRMQARKRTVADKFASSISNLLLEELVNRGDVPLPAGVKPSFYYEGQNKDALGQCSWVGASRGQIDELKETQAAILRLNNNLSTLEEESSRLGKDFREVLTQRSREKRMIDELGLATKPQELVKPDTIDTPEQDGEDQETDEDTNNDSTE